MTIIAIRSAVNHICVWNRARRDLVRGAARDQARFEPTRLFDGANFGAAAAVRAAIRVHIARLVAQGYSVIAGLANHVEDLGARHHLDIRMDIAVHERGRDGRARAAVTVIGSAAAEHAVVRRKHKAELRYAATQAVHGFDQFDADPGFGEINRRAHSGYAAPQNHDGGRIVLVIAIGNHIILRVRLY